ncbi:SlyX family protein [Kordiimonas gwangyangensis]|uniref:SlyX family protein n=1 Tax=Kordiimonas gwangyangensis TaxID=288022 RepID=UPI00037C2288|nr:SlyX family protein [Kordiimonas gwangyangensis]
MTDKLDERIADLEVKFAFQQETIDILNDTVTKQWAAIDRLSRALDRVQSDVADMEAGQRDPKGEPPPPHY